MQASSTDSTVNGAATLEPAAPEAKRYERQKLTGTVVNAVLSLAALALAALLLGPRIDGLVRRIVGDNDWLRLVAVGFVYASVMELLTLPVGFWSGFVLEHRFGLSNQTFRRWVWRRVKGYLIGGPVGLALLLGLYVLLWYGGAWWWAWATAGWLALTLVLGQVLPTVILPLFYKVTPLDDASLLERLKRLTVGTGLKVQGIYRLGLSADTKKANAALAGLGRTRRVLLGDTLLDEFTPEEIEVVFAHEVGHHVYRHLPKMIVAGLVLAAIGFWLVDRVLHGSAQALGYGGFDDPAALPLVLLVLSLLGLVLAPAQNAVSRFFERQCDRYALDKTGLVRAYRSAFLKLARLNKADLDPHPLVVWLFDDHPPIRERLAMASSADKETRRQGDKET
jgi:STE24 endopeptidase